MESNQVTFKAKLYKELYYNESNSFCIALMHTKEEISYAKNGIVTIKGACTRLDEDIEYIITGSPVHDKNYGWQYNIVNIFVNNLDDTNTMKQYLSSIISEDKVDVLLEHYPNIVNDILENTDFEPDYSLLYGIKEASFTKIKNKILDTYLISDILALLSPLGVSFTMIKRISGSFKNVSLLKQEILKNPYMLTNVPLMGFKKVDKFALNLNPDFLTSEYRMQSALRYILNQIGEEEGHSCVKLSQLESELKNLVPEVMKLYRQYIFEEEENTKNGKINELYVKDGMCGLASNYRMEKYIYDKLNAINEYKNELNLDNFEERIEHANKYLGFELSEQQCEIIKSVATRNVTIISGKAGTGKTSLIKGILNVYRNSNFAMCSLSAKAARRIVEATGFRDAKTIHRLLKYNMAEGFTVNEENPLQCDILIIDEASMVNIYLFYSLLKATPKNCKIIIVGDDKQLPPIGTGAIFTDLLNMSKNFNSLLLTKIYRQAEQSGIIVDANKVRNGIMPFNNFREEIISGQNKDMLYKFKNDRGTINNLLLMYFKYYIDRGVSIEDVIILVPRKDNCINSTKEINKKIQDMVIPSDVKSITYGKSVFKLGDRVINTINNYQKDVMNGEIGTVISINDDNMSIDFDGNIVVFNKGELEGIELGYAMTIHKLQGSSSKYVIIGLDNTHYTLLSSNLIYTAITRSERKCLIVAEPSAFQRCVKNNKENHRNTFLKMILKGEVD